MMKTIRQFLDAAGSKEPKPQQKGKFSDWLPFHPLNLKGNALQFVEVRVLGLRGHKEHECVEIPASPGVYAIECRGVQFGSDTRIAGLRAYPAGLDPKRGKKLKEISVDLGGIAVVDIVAVHASMQQDAGRYEAWLEQLL